MRVVLADLKSNRGFVSKDTVVGGYGSRLDPFSRVTAVMAYIKKQFHDVPSVHMAYIAAILARAGHDVEWTRGDDLRDGRCRARAVVARRLQERDRLGRSDARARRQGRVHRHHRVEDARALQRITADFILNGEPEAGVMRIAQGDDSDGNRRQRADRRSRFAAVSALGSGHATAPRSSASDGRRVPSAAASRCSRAVAARSSARIARTGSWPGYRARSIANIVDELERLCDQYRRPYVIFRDPLFTEQRERCLELCDEIQARGLALTFEAETRLDRLDIELLDRLYAAGFRAMSFGVESLSPATLKKSGRRPIPEAHQRADHRALPQARHRHGGVLRARVPPGRLELDRRDDRLRDRSRIDLRAVQDPDAVSGHADVQAARAAADRNRLGKVRRLHADVPASESDGPRAAVPARRGVHALLHAAVVPGELPEDSEHRTSASG